MGSDAAITYLNHLIALCKEDEENFRGCSEDTTNARLKSLFSDRAQSCATSSRELQDIVRNLGGTAANCSTIVSAMQRYGRRVRRSMFGMDDAALLEECERREKAAMRSYSASLASDLPDSVKLVLERHCYGIRQDYAKIRRLHAQVLDVD